MRVTNGTRFQPRLTPFSFFEWVGSTAMDFGFGAFLEKFEEYFGRGMTRALMALIGIFITVFCGAAIVKTAIFPIYKLLVPVVAKETASSFVAPLFTVAGGVSFGGFVGIVLLRAIEHRIYSRKIKEVITKIQSVTADIQNNTTTDQSSALQLTQDTESKTPL